MRRGVVTHLVRIYTPEDEEIHVVIWRRTYVNDVYA